MEDLEEKENEFLDSLLNNVAYLHEFLEKNGGDNKTLTTGVGEFDIHGNTYQIHVSLTCEEEKKIDPKVMKCDGVELLQDSDNNDLN